jgi:hypothetical protein
MRHAKTPQKPFQLSPGRDYEKYDGKTVEFICDSDGALLVLTGRFVVHIGPKYQCVDIHYAGRLDPLDPPYANYVFHVSDADLRSAIPARNLGSPANFLLERPLWSSGCRKLANAEVQPRAGITLPPELRASLQRELQGKGRSFSEAVAQCR